jgi:hypothetical protein
MPVASRLADLPPSAAQLIEVLAALGRPVTAHSGDPAPTVLHLARLLVAVAERHAIAAELALGVDARHGHDVDEHQQTYDTASVRAAFELLTLAHWRARRLTATVTALRDTAGASAEDEDDDPDGMTELWNLAVHTTLAADAILAVLAQLVTPPADDTAAAVDRLDAATALLVNVGESAGKLRATIGLDSGD